MVQRAVLPRVRFTKMHGLGNDFVILDEFEGFSESPVFLDSGLASQLANRHFGIGCDQVVLVGPSRDPRAHARMEIWNADGLRAEMCRNGIRSVALYLHDHGPPDLRGGHLYDIETGAGVLTVTLQGRQVRVNMGPPQFASLSPERLETSVGMFDFWEVSMGNPHAVIFVPRVDDVPLERVGPVIEIHKRFPKRVNVEFVEVLSPTRVRIRIWERGAGATLASGAGACASAVASILSGATTHTLEAVLPGGSLHLEWSRKMNDPVWMTGSATEVFSGQTS